MTRRRLFSLSWFFLLSVAACSGCSESGPTAPPDRGSPLIEVRFPTSATAFDRDSNGLVDLEVAFSDSLSGIDVGSIEIVANRPLKGPAGQAANLFQVWRVVRADTSGFVVEETVDNLLPRSRTTLTISVADRAGNRVSRTLTVDLPPAVRYKVIALETDLVFNSGQITIGSGGDRAYVTTGEDFGSAISIVDLRVLALLKVIRSPIRALSRMALDEGRNRLYLMSIDEPFVGVFDLGSESFLAPIEVSSRGFGVALSRTRDRLYIGLEAVEPFVSGAFISVIDLTRGIEERVIDLDIASDFNPVEPVHMFNLLLDQDDERLFASTGSSAQEGILVIDADEGVLLDQIDVWPENPQLLGDVNALRLDNGNLLATTADRIALIPLVAPEAMRFGFINPDPDISLKPFELAIAPDGTEYALTIVDRGAGFHAVQLMDAASLRVVWEDRLPASAWNPRAVAFRPDGHVFMTVGSRADLFPATSPAELTIYLYR